MTHAHVTESVVIVLVDLVKLKLNIGYAGTRNFTFWLGIFLEKQLKYLNQVNKDLQ